jgi:hypothetical protein
MAVGERYTGHVPENEHEAELLVVHIPGNVLIHGVGPTNVGKTYHVVMIRCSPLAHAPAYR